jgi:hypothetical protein
MDEVEQIIEPTLMLVGRWTVGGEGAPERFRAHHQPFDE